MGIMHRTLEKMQVNVLCFSHSAQGIYNSSVPIQDVALKTSREKWPIETGGESGPMRSLLAARHDDDDDDL